MPTIINKYTYTFFAIILYAMGASNTTDRMKQCLAEVSAKCEWKVGLTVDMRSVGKFVVSNVAGIQSGPPNGTLKCIDGIYTYVVVGKLSYSQFPAHVITFHADEVKIGGARTEFTDDITGGNDADNTAESEEELIIVDTIPNFTKEYKYEDGDNIKDIDL